jgi:hypothetical protein
MALLARKLSQFLNMKNEEQLVITSLVSFCVALLSAATIVPPTGVQLKANQRLHNSCYLSCLLDVLLAVEKIWLDMRGHVMKIPEFGIKFTAVRHIMLQTATNRRVDPVLRKLVEKETVQTRKILESSVMAREMLAEVRGSVHATKKLRASLQSLSIPDKCKDASLDGSQWGRGAGAGWGLPEEDLVVEEEDIWEKNEESEYQRKRREEELGRGAAVQVREADFLEEVDALEKGLESIMLAP